MKKLNVLNDLIDSLDRLVSILALDPKWQWTRKFEADLAVARHLRDQGGDVDDLHALSGSIRQVYAGMGSFNDYAPCIYNAITGRYAAIPGTNDLDIVAQRVFGLAVDLITIEP